MAALPPVIYDVEEAGTERYNTLVWCEERLRVGRLFVEASVGYDRIQPALDAIFAIEKSSGGVSYAPVPKPLSRTRANLCAKTAEDLTAMLTDTKVFWNYSTRNPKYELQVDLANKQAEDWYISRTIDLRLTDMIRWYSAAGSAFAHLYYDRRLADMMVEVLDPRMVFPVEPISYHTVQDALGVIVRKARTPAWVEDEYGKKVAPDVGDPGIFGWFKRTFSTGRKHSGPLSPRGRDKDEAIPQTPTVFVNTLYLDDKRKNEKSESVFMGKWKDGVPQSTWSYEVKPGMPLYPYKRMIVWTTDCLLYDGPNPYWHGKFPILKLTLNPWPKTWLGKAPLWDIVPLNESYNNLMRVIDDHAAQVAQPGVVADRNVSRAELQRFNSRSPGYQIRTNLAAGKGIQVQPPPPLDNAIPAQMTTIRELMRELSGTADISQIAQLNQIPSDDTIETMMKAMTPGVRLRSRYLEGFMLEFAEMYLWSIAQFDTLPKRIARFGPDAITPEDYDYEPGSFIPDNVPDGTPGDVAGTLDAMQSETPLNRYDRARLMLMSFTSAFKPGSLLNSAGTQEKMEDFLLSKMGYISWFTLMERLGKKNLWPPGLKVPPSELERLQLQQQLGLGMTANAQGRKSTNQEPAAMGAGADGSPTITTS